MFHIILHRPEIPQNTGNVGRTCAVTGSRLHLIYPLGFTITDAKLRRAGMDYWYSLDVHHHADWAAFLADEARPPGRLWLLTTHAQRTIWDADFADGDGLVFGNEGSGAPEWLHESIGEERRITIPQFNPALRSLNLATAAAITAYEALRQIRQRQS
ncbi:MAG: tRNA (cytidine(34)-2'-O)-methyltransferase [Puniceicoccales bacterium]|jgi:tRNA (cytidine/uridine-2'-O-)-methyltransferase|nr:tRNA (cytidine(34)-2'-O)-methyltransferase [Puniceicoccales bacterium]